MSTRFSVDPRRRERSGARAKVARRLVGDQRLRGVVAVFIGLPLGLIAEALSGSAELGAATGVVAYVLSLFLIHRWAKRMSEPTELGGPERR